MGNLICLINCVSIVGYFCDISPSNLSFPRVILKISYEGRYCIFFQTALFVLLVFCIHTSRIGKFW